MVGSPSNLDKAREIPAPPPIVPTSRDATSNMYVVHEAVQFESAVPRPVPMNMHSGPLKRTREASNIEDDAWEKFTTAHGPKCLRCTTSPLEPVRIVEQLKTLSIPYKDLWDKANAEFRRGASARVRSKKRGCYQHSARVVPLLAS